MGVRIGEMSQPAGKELNEAANQMMRLRYLTKREVDGQSGLPRVEFAMISDLCAKKDKRGWKRQCDAYAPQSLHYYYGQ